MLTTQEWKAIIVTPGKIYEGKLSCNFKLQDKRTLTLLNTKIVSCIDKDSLENYLSLTDVSLLLNGKRHSWWNKVFIKKSQIIFAYDEYKQMGSESERKRFATIQSKRSQGLISINILTLITKDIFYDIKGEYKGAFKEIVNRQFVPLVNVVIEEIIENEGQVFRKSHDPKPFIALNKDYIESIHIIN